MSHTSGPRWVSRPRGGAWAWLAVLLLLIVLRLPSLVQPAGGDQGLFAYAGQRTLAGGVMYRDMWDQKPPGIGFVYAALLRVWPYESVVPGADLAAATLVALLLVAIGRRRFSATIGFGAAAIFLLFGDPYLQRLSGVYVRGQCEPFMALAIATGVWLLAHPARRRAHLILAGVALAAVFWLKYAGAYALPLAVAAWAWSPRARATWRDTLTDLCWIGLGFGVVLVAVIGYFAARGALVDLRLATLDYNLAYANETYESRASVLRYLVMFPVTRAGVDMIWFLGGLGTLLLVVRRGVPDRSTVVAVAWLLASVVSIAINGSRSLPNYFVQAFPALALCGAAGLATVRARPAWVRAGVAVLIVAAVWRVGSDTPVWGLRWGSLPGLVENVQFDVRHAIGQIDRETYLQRFKGVKFDAVEIDRLVRYVRETTAPEDPIFVFGFSGGSVCWRSDRRSASRFFWSRPVTIEFAAERPDYGPAGMLRELTAARPALVVLQKDEWRSREFFLGRQALRDWLEAGYVADRDTPMFSVWRRKGARPPAAG